MRILWEIVTLVAGIAIILAVAKGFPGFGRVLGTLFLNPIGLLCVIGLVAFVALRRHRASTAPGRDPSRR